MSPFRPAWPSRPARLFGAAVGCALAGCIAVAAWAGPDETPARHLPPPMMGGPMLLLHGPMLDHVLAEAPEQERMEAWIVEEVNKGAVLPGLYPMNAETKARYAASKK